MISPQTSPQAETANRKAWGPEALAEVRDARRAHQETNTAHRDEYIQSNQYFYDRCEAGSAIHRGAGQARARCSLRDRPFAGAVRPGFGVGVEISDAMVERAREQHPDLHFVQSDPEDSNLNQTFDYILFNHIFDTVDILRALECVKRHCTPETPSSW